MHIWWQHRRDLGWDEFPVWPRASHPTTAPPVGFKSVVYDSRSKVLNKNFNLGGTQPTLLYDFTSSLCGVTQGNPAKHKLGARFAQGWRKCFHVLSWNISFTYNIYIYSHTLYVYRLYHQSFSWNMLFVFKEQRFQNMSIQQLQNWEIKLHFSRKLRASPAQAKKCIWVK